MNIILIGFMGSGKTAVGQLLAKELAMDFLDTDELVEKTVGRKIPEIFASEGEAHFRELETEVLKTLQDYDNYVLSTGGGMVLRTENAALLRKLGPVVLLWAEPAVIYQRVEHETHRPLLRVVEPLAEIQRRLAQREPFYRQAADRTIDTSRLGVEEVAKEITTWLKSRST